MTEEVKKLLQKWSQLHAGHTLAMAGELGEDVAVIFTYLALRYPTMIPSACREAPYLATRWAAKIEAYEQAKRKAKRKKK